MDSTINDALRTVTGCLRPTPSNNLPVMRGIQTSLQKILSLSLTYRASKAGHLLHSPLTTHLMKCRVIYCQDSRLYMLHIEFHRRQRCANVEDGIGRRHARPDVAMDPECCGRPRQDSAFYRIRIRYRSEKFFEKRTRIWSHFSFSAIAGVRVDFINATV